MNKPEIFFHVGMPRTASTFLQRKVFPNLTGIRFVKKHDFKKYPEIISEKRHQKYLLSTEMDIGVEGRYDKLVTIAQQFPDIKILLVLRRHDSWIKSKYQYLMRKNGSLTFHEFFNLNNTGTLRTEHLNYMRKIEIIEKLFKNPPLVIFQEELRNNLDATLNYLASFLGATLKKDKVKVSKVNKSFNSTSLYYLQRINRYFKFDTVKVENRFLKKLYEKFLLGLLTRTVVLFSSVFGKTPGEEKDIIQKKVLDEIKNYYSEDWKAAIEYARKTREVYIIG